ncbi:cation transporter [Aureimonas sp. Leaf454]|uniref:cation:proton antiporter domain-containing protein n=1 Tax=Aureimonas sp. Leaf454 TaxID=1736381 RepID=UPI0006F9CCF4|nr:cation:proton antiporter [Aureimonas sp. Leaf454]KQT51058.1 cation transporter [Aureimonas sp. Leaf454]
MHETGLIATIAIGFVLAFVFGYLASRLRLPPLVGYLVAGVFAGPFTPGFQADAALAGQLAEIGVILLMFGVGLHFSVQDLMAVRRIAIPGAIGQILLATLLGMGLAHLFGWTLGAGIVFGLSLSVASTVVLLKALEEGNLLDTPKGRVAVGWLIVEDLAMVVALVLLPAFAGVLGGTGAEAGGHAPAIAGDASLGLTLAVTLGKVAAFVAIAMLIGPRIVPWLLAEVARTGSRELFTLSVLALALGIAFGSAAVFGVSFALGAFFAGVVLSESHFSHRAARDSLPLQDAFSVLFFVSVGLLFDPSILVRQPLEVLATLALVMVGKSIIAFGIVVLLGFPLSLGLGVSASLAQIGEFSFILAGLGLSLGLLPEAGHDLILAAAILSITLNPVAFRVVEALRRRIGASGRADLLSFGRARQEALEDDLAANRRRNEARGEARALELQALLDTFPVLGSVGPEEQDELLLLFRPKTAAPGTRVIRKGDRADGMYFIGSGRVEVELPGGDVVDLEAGAFFGEMALLTGSRRTADVTAMDYCQFLMLERRDFALFMSRHPEVRAAVKAMAAERNERNRQSSAERDIPDGVAVASAAP